MRSDAPGSLSVSRSLSRTHAHSPSLSAQGRMWRALKSCWHLATSSSVYLSRSVAIFISISLSPSLFIAGGNEDAARLTKLLSLFPSRLPSLSLTHSLFLSPSLPLSRSLSLSLSLSLSRSRSRSLCLSVSLNPRHVLSSMVIIWSMLTNLFHLGCIGRIDGLCFCRIDGLWYFSNRWLMVFVE